MVRHFIRLFSLGALVCLCAASCRKKELGFPEQEGGDQPLVTSLQVQTDDTLSFAPGARLSAWEIVGKGRSYTFTTSSGGQQAIFQPADTTTNRLAYALYPDIACDSLYRGCFYLELDDTQAAIKNSYDSGLCLRAGHIKDAKSSLQGVTGTLKFTMDQTDIYKCTLRSKGNNAVAGPIRIVMDESVRAEAVSNSSGQVVLEGAFEKGGIYNAVVIADEYTAFDVILENSLGINVFEGTAGAFAKLAPGESLDLGHIGNPKVSSLSLKFSSSEFAGCNVKSVIGYDAASGKKILGNENCGTVPSQGDMEVCFYGLEPTDYSSSKIWFVFTLENEAQSRVLPIEEDGFIIPEATRVNIDLGVLDSSRNAAPWYYPYEDRRIMSGEGYAFGEANTYLIQYKESSYCSVLDPDPDIPSSVVIDYRVRGDLFKSPRPDNVEFAWLEGYNNSTPAWGKYTMDRSYIYNCDKYSFTVDSDNYKVTVTNTGAHAGAPILVMKDASSGDILWAWTFWNIAADGTRLQAVDFGGVLMANMDIGHCSTQKEQIVAKLKEIRYSANYYQWGRPIPTFSGSGTGVYFSQADDRNAAKPRVPVHDGGALSVKQALSHPGYLLQNPYQAGSTSENLLDWIAGGSSSCTDLWGGPESTDSQGAKSIYDPCPKGWRVPDAATYLNVIPQAKSCYSVSEFPQEHTEGYQGVYVGNLLFVTNGVLQTNVSAEKYVSCGGYTHGTNVTANSYGRVWTNTWCSGTKAYDFRTDYMYVKFNKAVENTSRIIKVDNSSVGCALPVRCQKDYENR